MLDSDEENNKKHYGPFKNSKKSNYGMLLKCRENEVLEEIMRCGMIQAQS